jgi:hypothetical protein
MFRKVPDGGRSVKKTGAKIASRSKVGKAATTTRRSVGTSARTPATKSKSKKARASEASTHTSKASKGADNSTGKAKPAAITKEKQSSRKSSAAGRASSSSGHTGSSLQVQLDPIPDAKWVLYPRPKRITDPFARSIEFKFFTREDAIKCFNRSFAKDVDTGAVSHASPHFQTCENVRFSVACWLT